MIICPVWVRICGIMEQRNLVLCGLVDMVEREDSGGGPPHPHPPSFSLLLSPVFIFFSSWLSLHAQCHIPIPHSRKLIRNDARLMETFPQNTPPPHTSPPFSLSVSSFSQAAFPLPNKDSTERSPKHACDLY